MKKITRRCEKSTGFSRVSSVVFAGCGKRGRKKFYADFTDSRGGDYLTAKNAERGVENSNRVFQKVTRTKWIILNQSFICSNQTHFNEISEKDLFLIEQIFSYFILAQYLDIVNQYDNFILSVRD